MHHFYGHHNLAVNCKIFLSIFRNCSSIGLTLSLSALTFSLASVNFLLNVFRSNTLRIINCKYHLIFWNSFSISIVCCDSDLPERALCRWTIAWIFVEPIRVLRILPALRRNFLASRVTYPALPYRLGKATHHHLHLDSSNFQRILRINYAPSWE